MIAFALSIVLAATASVSQRCETIATLTATRLFANFPAPRPDSSVWYLPDTRSGRAHLYRTALHEITGTKPNFAGNWSVVEIGCGAATVCPGFVNRANGRVIFLPTLKSIAPTSDLELLSYGHLVFRADSRLLVVFGTPNENEAHSGAYLFDWHSGHPRLVRFIAERDLCGVTR